MHTVRVALTSKSFKRAMAFESKGIIIKMKKVVIALALTLMGASLTANAGLISLGGGNYNFDDRGGNYFKLEAQFGHIQDFGILTSTGGRFTLMPERTDYNGSIFYASLFNNTPLNKLYSYNGESIIDFDNSVDTLKFYVKRQDGDYISGTRNLYEIDYGFLATKDFDTDLSIYASSHPYNEAFYPAAITPPNASVSEPASFAVLTLGLIGLIVRRKQA